MKANIRQIVEQCFDYYELKNKRDALNAQMDTLKAAILKNAKKGKYGRYTVYSVDSAVIHVRSYTRSGYKALRQSVK